MRVPIYFTKGHDKRGVALIQGDWNDRSYLKCLFALFLGIVMLFSALAAVLGVGKPHASTCYWLSSLLAGALLIYNGVHSFFTRKRIKKLNNANSISSRFGVEAERLTAFAEEQGIRPRYNINGEDFYAIEDFGDAAVLLRASVAPLAGPETLLRPAIGTQTPEETLLRPSSVVSQTAPQSEPTIAQAAQSETQTLTNGKSDTP